MKIAALDDEKIYRERIIGICKCYFPGDMIETFDHAAALIHKGKAYDLLLLDIEMPETDGITFVKNYGNLFRDILFLTSYDKYVFQSFLPNVRGYVLKKQMDKVLIDEIRKIKKQRKDVMLFHTDFGEIEISKEHIQYFYTEDTFVYLVTLKNRYSLTYKSLKQLPINYNEYVYVNRGYLVRTAAILDVLKTTANIRMRNRDMIKVSRRSWKKLLEAYMKNEML